LEYGKLWMIKKSCQVKKNRLQFEELSFGSDNSAIYYSSTGYT
jgi:hypothetical protein